MWGKALWRIYKIIVTIGIAVVFAVVAFWISMLTGCSSQKKVKVNNYIIDLNSREMLIKDNKLKLTEKEINTITYLSKSDKPVSIDELQEKVWSYQSDIETHTVETHIYRLRKKIKDKFNDNNFILSEKKGYFIK